MPHEDLPDIAYPARAQVLEKLKQEIGARLRPVCPNMPTDEFDRMVAKLAAIELKYTYQY